MNAVVGQKTDCDAEEPVEKKQKKKEELDVTGGSTEILLQVETEPVKDSCVAIGFSGNEDVVDGSFVDQRSDKPNWQNRKVDNCGQIEEKEKTEIFRSCVNQYEMAKTRIGSEIPKTMSIAGMNRINENNGARTSDNRFTDVYNYPMAAYANVAETNYNARYLPRNWIGHQNEQN